MGAHQAIAELKAPIVPTSKFIPASMIRETGRTKPQQTFATVSQTILATAQATESTFSSMMPYALVTLGITPKKLYSCTAGLQPDTHVDALANSTLPTIPKGSNYRAFLGYQFNKIRKAAPNARITMVNYLPMTVNDTLCVINEAKFTVPLAIQGATRLEDEFNREIGRAADALGANFINLHDQAKTHDPCQPDASQRWAVAVKTPTAPSVMPMHPTDIGHDGMARVITRELQSR